MKKIIISIVLLIISTSVFSQIDRSKPPKSGPSPVINLGQPSTFTLKNGLKVIVVENKKLPRAYASLDVDNYPDFEGDIKGVSSLVSALMGNGTKNQSKDDFNEEVDYMGASLSLSAGGGYASSLKKYFPRIMEMMSDGLLNPLFTQEEFLKERNILVDGIKSAQKSVPDIASQVGDKLFYGANHPYGEFATIQTVENITLEDVQNYYSTYAKPNNAYLTIVGDVDFNEIKKLVTSLFKGWKKGKLPEYEMPTVNDVSKNEINFVDMSNAVQSEITVGNIINISMADPDYFALRLANQILGGSGGRLYENLREDKGFTYGAYSGVTTSRYVGNFYASTSVRNEVTDSSVVEIINEINRIISDNVSESKLASVKEKFVGNFIMSTERPSTIATFALNIDKYNLPGNFYETYLDNFQKVTVEDIKRVTNKYFKNNNLRIVIVGKGKDVIPSLEKSPYEIKYYDTNGDVTEKPDYSVPTGISANGVLLNYLEAIGGKEKVESVNAVSLLGEAEFQGMKLQLMNINAKPNKLVVMMMMMGNVLMKQAFNGEEGYIQQQGVNNPFPQEEIDKLKKSSLPFEEIGWLDNEDVKFSSIESEDGKELYALEVNGDTYVYYDKETGFKIKQTQSASMPDGTKVSQTTYYENYISVDGILFPHIIKVPMGPQNMDFNMIKIVVNPEVSDSDFN
jgi:predicted Zn-dependent peptidase